MEQIEIEEGEVITSFDIIALFTSMPGKEVVQMAIQRAKENSTWNEKVVVYKGEEGRLFDLHAAFYEHFPHFIVTRDDEHDEWVDEWLCLQ